MSKQPTFCDMPDASSPAGPASADVSLLDWDDLFRAVKDRLRAIADTHADSRFDLRLPGDTPRIDTGVLECVAALEQLHLTMRHERDRREQLEWAVAEAHAALALAQAEKRNG